MLDWQVQSDMTVRRPVKQIMGTGRRYTDFKLLLLWSIQRYPQINNFRIYVQQIANNTGIALEC